MKNVFTTILIFQMALVTKAQHYVIRPLQDHTGIVTSYYDILKTKDNQLFICGKNGAFSKIENDSVILVKQLPETLYKLLQINDSTLLITGNTGSLYYYNRYKNTIIEKRIAALKYACIYSSCKENDTTYYICGGHSKIASGKKALPRGYIYRTYNSGATWNKVCSRKLRMFWDIQFDTIHHAYQALTYSPWNSKLITRPKFHSSMKSKFLLHQFAKNTIASFAGGMYKKNIGCIQDSAGVKNIKPFCWSAYYVNGKYISVHNQGLVYISELGSAKLINSNTSNNMYEIEKYNDNVYYLVGSNNTILKLTISY